MRRFLFAFPFALTLASFLLSISAAHLSSQALDTNFARDPGQAIDQKYTDQILNTPRTSRSFRRWSIIFPPRRPCPRRKVLGDVSGAPNMLPYAEDVYKYFRMLEAASPRVKVVTIGHSEEGREMIAVAIADPELLARGRRKTARAWRSLADPRTIGMDDAKARALIDQSYPVYYITGTIHSTETGAPTALMELAYRLAVDDCALHQVHPLAHDCADHAGG